MRLRPESAAEAAATRDAARTPSACEAEILRWSEAKPRTGLQQAARAARYRLLREACRRRGILHLLVAHHADDQAETVAMRAARQSGPDGLAGMSAAVELPEVRLLRPLLGGFPVAPHRDAARARRAVDRRSFQRRSALRAGKAARRQSAAAAPAADTGRPAREQRLAAAAVEALEVSPDGRWSRSTGRPSFAWDATSRRGC